MTDRYSMQFGERHPYLVILQIQMSTFPKNIFKCIIIMQKKTILFSIFILIYCTF